MNLLTIGRLIAEQRQAKGYTLSELASKAQVGRSTLAALEAGKLSELGLGRVARLCSAVDLVTGGPSTVASGTVDAASAPHRYRRPRTHQGRHRRDFDQRQHYRMRSLVRAIAKDKTGGIARRVNELTAALGNRDPKVRAFAALLPRAISNGSRDA
jgi:transcriptional regulator with XRE-family HTH domain